jgi:hypothetical protein
MWENDIYNAKYFLVNALLCDMITSFLYQDYLFFAADCDLRVMPHVYIYHLFYSENTRVLWYL